MDRHPAPPLPFAIGPVLSLATVKLLLHLAVNFRTPYGIHRDELLYLAMGRNLELWGMDFPPAIGVVAEVSRTALGESLVALRFVPAICGTAILVLAALIARELGGGRFAQALAALAVLTSPLFLRSANLLQPVVLDQLVWTAALYVLLRQCRDYRHGRWLLLGLVLGLGVLTKFTVAFIGLGIAGGVLLSPLRAGLRTPWPWLGAAIALALGAPSLVGQIRLDFPVLGQMADLRDSQLERLTPLDFVLGQLLWGPAVVLAVLGLSGLLGGRSLRPYRAVGWSCAAAFILLLLLQGKAYYAGPLYPTLFAAGSGLLERMPLSPAVKLARIGAVVVLLAFGLLTLPLGVPILPPAAMAEYARALGVTAAVRTNAGELGRLPQDYADMLGWPEQAAAVAEVYHALPPEQRGRAVLVADNYGEAGALDFYGPRLGLPRAVSPTGSYWFFGPGEKPGEVVVTIGVSADALRPLFDSVERVATVDHPWAVEEERHVPIHVARGARTTLQELWPTLAGQN